jgi:hypothetical protein
MRGGIEGFDTSPALEDVFTSVLKVPKANIIKSANVPGTTSKQTVPTKGAACPKPTASTVRPVIQNSADLKNISPYTPTPFLKTLINNEKKAVESLLRVAAKIGPVAHTVVEKEKAYDAAFQSKIPAPIPTYGSTLQGFAFILFFWSYIALAIVMTVFTNGATGSSAVAAGTMTGFAAAGVLMLTLIKRFG